MKSICLLGCIRLTLFRNKNKRNKPQKPFDWDAYPIPDLHRMYSKHSALGSRILGIIRNNDVMASSHARVFWNNNQKCCSPLARKNTQDLGSSFGKISCKENIQRQKESLKFCRCRSRSSNYAIFGHFTVLFCREIQCPKTHL